MTVVLITAMGGGAAATTQAAGDRIVTKPSPSTTGSTPAVETAATDWWNDNWQYRRQLDITERSNTDLEQYPVVTPSIDIGDASVGSLRVVNEATGEQLPFAVRETNAGHQLAFKISVSASATNSSIALYYGNPDAESVAIPWKQARYNFYDDFNDGELDGWNIQDGNWVESDGTL
ncbi:MAG: DUF2341 domain-containing protein [Halobacteriales archaeon]